MSEPQLEYRDYASLHLDLAWIYNGMVPRLFQNTSFQPDFMGAWLVLNGEVELTQRGKTVVAYPDEWLIMKKVTGTQRFSEGTRIRSIRFQAEWPDGQPFFHAGLSAKAAAEDFPELGKTSSELLKYVQSAGLDANYELRVQPIQFEHFINIRSLFHKWFFKLYECLKGLGVQHSRSAISDNIVLNALHHLSRISLSSSPTMRDLAEQAGVSMSQFNLKFRSEVGVTPKRYFINRKLSACRRLLAFSDLPIKEVAYDLGFTRLSDFSAWFRSSEGIPPREYRTQSRGTGSL